MYASAGYGFDVFTYPEGRFVDEFTLNQRVGGLCSDSSGNVWLAASQFRKTQVLEYAHGGTQPLVVMNAPGQQGSGCSVDPITGSLAVSASAGSAYVDVFRNAPKYPPVGYRVVSDAYFTDCTYDDKGDLFVAGMRHRRQFVFYELPKGSATFVPIALDHTIARAGSVQWDGSHVAVADADTVNIYRFVISKGHGTLVGTTTLENSALLDYQFWIESGTVVGEPDNRNQFAYWNYPAGGLPTRTLTGSVFNAFTVSR